MELDIKDVITLDDKDEYVVVSKVIYEGKTYCYLSNMSGKTEFKICLQEDDFVTDVTNIELIEVLITLFAADVKNIENIEEE